MKTIFTFYADPAHAWLKVSLRDLLIAGLSPVNFSRYSYRTDDAIYLEEDCDAPKFINAWKAAGKEFLAREEFAKKRSRVRNYPRNV
jgi:hypothetical protein